MKKYRNMIQKCGRGSFVRFVVVRVGQQTCPTSLPLESVYMDDIIIYSASSMSTTSYTKKESLTQIK